MKKKTIKKIVNIASYILIAVLLAIVVFLVYCNLSNKVAYIGNYSTVRIVSESMETQIPKDTYILIEKTDTKQLAVGDVIIFYSTDPSIYGKLNTHRIYDIDEDEDGNRIFTTKGDNNPVCDTYKVKESAVAGKYVKNLDFLSSAAAFISQPLVFILLIIIPALVLMFLAVKDIKDTVDSNRHEKILNEEIEKEVQRLLKEGGVPEGNTDNVSKVDTEDKDKAVQEEDNCD